MQSAQEQVADSIAERGLAAELQAGMYVRVPMDLSDTPMPGEHRDYRIGQLVELLADSDAARVRLLKPVGGNMQHEEIELPMVYLRRCMLAAQAQFTHRDTHQQGRVLLPRQFTFTPHQFCMYYVELGDRVALLSEDKMYVAFNEQSPDPVQQLKDYEFHPPQWKSRRDSLVESYAALQSATFGIEDLVGARIALLSHQSEVVSRVLADRVCRYVLADEVGLGKTIEACVILKGLRRRHPHFRALIVVPDALLRQWHNELNSKFWLEFAVARAAGDVPLATPDPGLIVSHEALDAQADLWLRLMTQDWDMLIVDEAHNLRRKPRLYERVRALSRQSERALILSATPIQRRSREYLALLRLMHPDHYDNVDEADFERMLTAQAQIRSAVAYLAKSLNPSDYDAIEFQTEIASVIEALKHDKVLASLADQVAADAPDRGLAAARETLQYISENYRIESRVIRNRRASLQIELPQRSVSVDYAYLPDSLEAETISMLHEYVAACMAASPDASVAVDYGRGLFHAAFSSPAALLTLLEARLRSGSGDMRVKGAPPEWGLLPVQVDGFPEERDLLERLIWRAHQWEEQTASILATVSRHTTTKTAAHRLAQVMRAIGHAIQRPNVKVLVFSAWLPTLECLFKCLTRVYGKQALARFQTGLTPEALQAEVDRFQSDDRCRILLSDESGGEGRNFQMADRIIHVDLPWTPAQIEQRIGRVDRLGRAGTVLSIIPVAKDTLEADLFNLWQQAFSLFEQSLSGLEIVLEDIQDQVGAALAENPRSGLADLLTRMMEAAKRLRADVEEEHYFEEGAINYRRRAEFTRIVEAYRDGERLREALLGWATMAGLHHHYNPATKVIVFDPKEFSVKAIDNAKFVRPPDMREALRRSGRLRNLVIKGTFDRDLAVLREDMVFFAPGELWTDSILTNALEADRGRCSAVLRYAPELLEDWHGVELFYRLRVDPRPLYAAGFRSTYLLHAQGYLETATHRLYISTIGEHVKPSSVVGKILRRSVQKNADKHLGKREGGDASPLKWFQDSYPPQTWHDLVARLVTVAEAALQDELSFMAELAEEARVAFAQSASGQRAAYRWLHSTEDASLAEEIREYEAISQALIDGIAHPLWQLESVCFWVLRAGTPDGS